MSDNWLSIVEYARRHNISDMTVRRRIKNGRLQAILREGKYYISERRDSVAAKPAHMQQQADIVAPRPENEQPSMGARYLPPIPPQHQFSREATQAPVHAQQLPATPSPPVQQRPAASSGEWAQKAHQNHRPHENLQYIPRDLANQVQQKQTAMVETSALLSYCDQTLKKLQSKERRTEELYQQKIKTLEAQTDAKNLEIKLLKEQVEDLELLVKVLEKK